MTEAPAPSELDEVRSKLAKLDNLRDQLINRLYIKIERLESRENQLIKSLTLTQQHSDELSRELMEARGEDYPDELDILRKDARAMQTYIDECYEADEFLFPPDMPNKEQERYWENRGWSWDNIGLAWCPPGYHIVRPGKIQRNDY